MKKLIVLLLISQSAHAWVNEYMKYNSDSLEQEEKYYINTNSLGTVTIQEQHTRCKIVAVQNYLGTIEYRKICE